MSKYEHAERSILGTRLREQREYLGYSQDEVADAVNITRSAVSLIETGQRKLEALELKRFATLYEKPVNYFTGDEAQNEEFTEDILVLTRLASNLKSSDVTELQRFAEYLQSRKETKQRGHNE